MAKKKSISVTILNGQSLSGAADLRGFELCALVFPAAWTAAGVSFQVSYDGVTFQDLYNATAEVTYAAAAANRALQVTPTDMAGVMLLKVRSGTSGTPVNQAADRIIAVIGRTAADWRGGS